MKLSRLRTNESTMNNIVSLMEKLTIDLYATLRCDAFDDLSSAYEYVEVPFVEKNLEKRINFKLHLDDCESIIVIAIPHHLTQANKSSALTYGGRVSAIALKKDYHAIVHGKLDQIEEGLKTLYDNLRVKKYVDTGPLIDKIIAKRAGLGYIAKNNLLLTTKYGTEVTIGYLLVNKRIQLKSPEKTINQCIDCNRCLDACPTGAISHGHVYDYQQCIAFLTQKKEDLTYEERKMISHHLYGCDICQTVCPANQNNTIDQEYLKKDEKIDLIKLIGLSNKQIQQQYRGYGFTWIGSKNLKRNALINCGNFHDKQLFDQLKGFLDHPSATVRHYTLWALYQSDPVAFQQLSFEKKTLMQEARNILTANQQ